MLLLTIAAKIFISSAILFGYYWMFLRNKRFHRYNRFYLLGIVVISLVSPFISIPVQTNVQEPSRVHQVINAITIDNWSDDSEQVAPKASNAINGFISTEKIMTGVYSIIALILLCMLGRSLFYIFKIRKQYPSENVDDLKIYHTTEPGTPFSFFRSIFWNNDLTFNSKKGQQIFRHEYYHVQQKHSLDVMLLEILCSVAWFNPFFVLIKRELKAIHEFLADQYSISEDDRFNYAEMLLLESIRAKGIDMVHPFFNTQIKRRIAMITQFKNKKYSYWSRILVLPIATLLFCIITIKAQQQAHAGNKPVEPIMEENFASENFFQNKDTVKSTPEALEKTILQLPSNHQNTLHTSITATHFYWTSNLDKHVYFISIDQFNELAKKHKSLNQYKEYDKTFVRTEIAAEYTGGGKAWIEYVKKNGQTPTDANGKKLSGVVELTFIIDKGGNVSDITAKYGDAALQQEAIRLLQNSGKWKPAIQNGHLVKAYKKEAITFDKDNGKVYPTPPVIIVEKFQPPVFTKVDKESEFIGGVEGWRSFLQKNLVYPESAVKSKLEGTVVVRFIVGMEGDVSNITAIEGNPILAQEAVRIIEKSGKWTPSIVNGKKVRAYRVQPILFRLAKTNSGPSTQSSVFSLTPEQRAERQQGIREVIAIARKEGKAAYTFKGRTYIFARIDHSQPENVNTYFECDDIRDIYIVLDGIGIKSIDEINAKYVRNDIKKMRLVYQPEASTKYSTDRYVVEIETYRGTDKNPEDRITKMEPSK